GKQWPKSLVPSASDVFQTVEKKRKLWKIRLIFLRARRDLVEGGAQLGDGRRLVQAGLGGDLWRDRSDPLGALDRLFALGELARIDVLDRHPEVIGLPPVGVALRPLNPLQHALEALHDPVRPLDVRFPNHDPLVHTAGTLTIPWPSSDYVLLFEIV